VETLLHWLDRSQDNCADLAALYFSEVDRSFCLAQVGWTITDGRPFPPGQHGYDPAEPDIWGLFVAIAPGIAARKLELVDNIDVYPLLCRLLGVTPESEQRARRFCSFGDARHPPLWGGDRHPRFREGGNRCSRVGAISAPRESEAGEKTAEVMTGVDFHKNQQRRLMSEVSDALGRIAFAIKAIRPGDHEAIVEHLLRDEAIPGFPMSPSYRETQKQDVIAALDFAVELRGRLKAALERERERLRHKGSHMVADPSRPEPPPPQPPRPPPPPPPGAVWRLVECDDPISG
jgi:hypothetical protein